METRILDAKVEFIPRCLRTPLILSSGPITAVTEARAEVVARVGEREGVGRSSIYLSDLWAWPDPLLSHEMRDSRMRALCETIAARLPALCGGEPAHPLELGLRLHDSVERLAVADDPPALARAVCLSPFDAALHDAAGQARGESAFALYRESVSLPSADPYFPEEGAAAAVARTLMPPRNALAAWLVVGSSDSEAEVAPWIRERGYRAFKLKIHGHDNAADAARTAAVYRAARACGAEAPRLCVDSNCANPDAESVRDYLERLRAADAEAFAALEYIEQPTGRDIAAHRFDWRLVTALKPVLLDEGLTSLDVMETAAEQGWSGFALKTCKGHSFALTAAAWAHRRGLRLALQDLTNPGLSAVHAFLFAAHVPTMNGVELNSPQFTPDANAAWLPRLNSLFAPTDGLHRLPGGVPVGLGSTA